MSVTGRSRNSRAVRYDWNTVKPVNRGRSPGVARRTLVWLALGCVWTVLAACAGASPVPPPGPRVGQQFDLAVRPDIAHAPLVSSDGRHFDLASLHGKIVVLSDVMTLCQETCPLDTANVVQAARDVEHAGLGAEIEFVSLTVDPQRDTRARLAAYRKLYQPAPANWVLATGDPATLSEVWKQLGVFIEHVPDKPPAPRDWLTGKPLSYDITHSDELFFIDTRSHERFVLEGAPHVAPGAPIPPRLAKFMDAKGHRNVTHPAPFAWTLGQELQVLSWLSQQHIPGASSS